MAQRRHRLAAQPTLTQIVLAAVSIQQGRFVCLEDGSGHDSPVTAMLPRKAPPAAWRRCQESEPDGVENGYRAAG